MLAMNFRTTFWSLSTRVAFGVTWIVQLTFLISSASASTLSRVIHRQNLLYIYTFVFIFLHLPTLFSGAKIEQMQAQLRYRWNRIYSPIHMLAFFCDPFYHEFRMNVTHVHGDQVLRFGKDSHINQCHAALRIFRKGWIVIWKREGWIHEVLCYYTAVYDQHNII